MREVFNLDSLDSSTLALNPWKYLLVFFISQLYGICVPLCILYKYAYLENPLLALAGFSQI